jgi:predicted O-methyltransferase YrrM
MQAIVGAAEIETWYRGKNLVFDWTSGNFPHWQQILAPLRDRHVRTLEVGSFEGRSALFFLNYLPHSSIVCVDAWDNTPIEPDIVEKMPEAAGAADKLAWAIEQFSRVQERFDFNVAPFGDRVTKCVGWSHEVLPQLGLRSERFDVIYVDGDHSAAGTYRDCIMSWAMLNAGGIMIIDDYSFMPDLPAEKRPRAGVDAFLATIPGRFDELHRAYQLVIREKSARRAGDVT